VNNNNNNNIRPGPNQVADPSGLYPAGPDPSRLDSARLEPGRLCPVRLGLSKFEVGSREAQDAAENRVFSVLREHREWHPRSINGASRVRQWSSTHAMRAVLEKQLRSARY
jgi:hypothetical protein